MATFAQTLSGLVPDQPFTVTHGLNTTDVVWSLREVASGAFLAGADVKVTGVDTITVETAAALDEDLRIVVIG